MKTYSKPSMSVVEFDVTDIVCTSDYVNCTKNPDSMADGPYFSIWGKGSGYDDSAARSGNRGIWED